MSDGDERGRGRDDGLRESLRDLMRRRFGGLSPAAVARIDAASDAQLAAWRSAFFDAASLEALLAVRP